MALEIEIKFLRADHAALRQRLAALGARLLGRYFESNEVFDDAARSLKAAGTLLRLREKPGRHVLTLKRSAARQDASAPALAKVYHEHETEVLNAQATRDILAGLGYAPALRYEKIREKWDFKGCEVCLDLLPFGPFAEIEGDEEAIRACAEALGLARADSSAATYHELNRRHREAAGLPPDESFVFGEADKARLLAELAGS